MLSWSEIIWTPDKHHRNGINYEKATHFLRGSSMALALDLSYTLDAVTLSGILKAKQKLGVTFNFDEQDVIDLTKWSKMTMCRASEANSEK
jgi:hypothetical protein